ncbi:MAG: copper chaperone PCu(A)C [Thioalkalivibrio sp.]|nr:copper chaperone PCu(A)C [Thioalkalivibrio sp.]
MINPNRILNGLALAGLLLAASPLAADPGSTGAGQGICDCPDGIELEGRPWVRLMPPTMSSTAAYLSLRNTTDGDKEIVAGESSVAAATELHDHIQDEQGVMRMRQVESITIPANGRVDLQPGGLHVMLIDLQEPLEEGAQVPLRLDLENGDKLHLRAEVRRAQRPSAGAHHHHDH